jgi:hypothetical protein
MVAQACCGGNVGCTAPYTRCGGNDVCEACGGEGQRCCDVGNGGYCGEPYVCAGGGGGNRRCAACGAANQPCCPGGVCSGSLDCNNGTTCQ